MRYPKRIKNVIAFCLLCVCLLSGLAQAFPFEIRPAGKSAIEKMSNTELVDAYVDAVVELQAVEMFYNNAGITPKEFSEYKTLLYYRANLIIEMQKRGLVIPEIK